MSVLKSLWVEKHKPSTLDDVIFKNEHEKDIFAKFVKNKSIPNLLLVGVQGTGKTTTSDVLVNELGIDKMDVLRINCSDEKIDAMRDKVKTFAYTMPVGDFKVVQLEELDYAGPDAQALLRVLIEDVSESCRFIATANYANKIIPAIQSRFQKVTFSLPNKDDVLIRAADILEKEKVEFDIEVLDELVCITYPDIRSTITALEIYSSSGKLVLSKGSQSGIADWKFELLDLLEAGKFADARKVVCNSASKEELQDIFSFLYQNSHKLKCPQDEAVVLIANYAYKHTFVADAELNVAALMIELGMLNGHK